MERRSTRGKQPPVTPAPRRGVAASRSEPRVTVVATLAPQVIPDNEVPQVGATEEISCRRGARQRKRNRLYFDEDIMVTPDNWGAKTKKVKSEPVEEDDEDSGEDILPGLADARARSRASQSPSPVKSPARQPAARKVVEVPVEKGGKKQISKGTPQKGGNRQPSLQLITPSPEKTSRPAKPKPSPAPPPKTPAKTTSPQIKIDPDGPLEPPVSSKKNIDKWGKLVHRAENLKKTREDRDDKRGGAQGRSSKGAQQADEDALEFLEKRTPKKDQQRQQQQQQQEKERERLRKEREENEEALIKEAERQERLQKEKEKKALLKEKKHRETIAVLPPVVKLASRTAYITTEDAHPQAHTISQQQLMAVIKLDDTTAQVIDKRVAHDISIRLRNLLKLPKAHKWVCYEWFYSNIDKVLFEGENDFQICLKESFPLLKARKLTRVEWTKIRRLMGKPRRCSQAFFEEEREELCRRRSKIRQIQQRKVTDFNYKELPDEIPLQLVIGTKVTARLRRPQDGLFTGTIEGVDTSNNTYRITFDRPGLGTHSIPDYEVLSNDPPETVSTSSFALKIPRRSAGFTVGTFKFQNPVLLGEHPEGFPKSPFPADGMLGGFPIRLLDMIVRLSKLLKAKREKIMTLKELNVEAEKLKSYGRPYNSEYRARYARCVLDLDSMNKEMAMYLEGIQTYCLEITNDHGSTTQMVIPEHILDNCRAEASMVVSTYNCKANRTLVHNQKIVGLVHQLTSLMLQVRALSSADRNLYELKSLKDTIRDVKASLEGKNLQCFQNKIEIPMNRIIAGLCVSQPKTY